MMVQCSKHLTSARTDLPSLHLIFTITGTRLLRGGGGAAANALDVETLSSDPDESPAATSREVNASFKADGSCKCESDSGSSSSSEPKFIGR